MKEWVGRERRIEDEMDPGPATRLWRVLDSAQTAQVGDPLPDGWQWLHFLPAATQSGLSPDGHEQRGPFYPPLPAPRRMFAGAKATYHKQLVLGHAAHLTEKIESITERSGRSGPLTFMRLGRRIVQDEALAIEEEQTIVYRSAPQPGEPAPAREMPALDPHWCREMTADPVLLFRFSALTFNAHRIHYDRDYSRVEEGYPGLVVHGPLIAVLLLEEARKHGDGRGFESFSFRAMQPLFDIAPFRLCGRIDGSAVAMWAEAADGSVAFRADAVLRLRRR